MHRELLFHGPNEPCIKGPLPQKWQSNAVQGPWPPSGYRWEWCFTFFLLLLFFLVCLRQQRYMLPNRAQTEIFLGKDLKIVVAHLVCHKKLESWGTWKCCLRRCNVRFHFSIAIGTRRLLSVQKLCEPRFFRITFFRVDAGRRNLYRIHFKTCHNFWLYSQISHIVPWGTCHRVSMQTVIVWNRPMTPANSMLKVLRR